MFKKIINTFGTKITAAVINFMIAVLLSQVLGDVGKGTQALLLTTISFILIFSEIVCGESIVFLTPHHPFKKILVASVAWSGLVALIMGAGIRLFYPGLEPDLVVHVAVLSFISCLSSINFRFLVGKEEIHKANYNTLLQPVLLILTLILCLALPCAAVMAESEAVAWTSVLPAMSERDLSMLVLANAAEPLGEDDVPASLINVIKRKDDASGRNANGGVYISTNGTVQLDRETANALTKLMEAAEAEAAKEDAKKTEEEE